MVDESGDPVGFFSDDRTQADATGSRAARWSTSIAQYAEVDGIRVGTHSDANWIEADGREWTYGRFVIREFAYDVTRQCCASVARDVCVLLHLLTVGPAVCETRVRECMIEEQEPAAIGLPPAARHLQVPELHHLGLQGLLISRQRGEVLARCSGPCGLGSLRLAGRVSQWNREYDVRYAI